AQDHDYIQNRLDAAGHGNVSVDEPQRHTNDDQDQYDVDQWHRSSPTPYSAISEPRPDRFEKEQLLQCKLAVDGNFCLTEWLDVVSSAISGPNLAESHPCLAEQPCRRL